MIRGRYGLLIGVAVVAMLSAAAGAGLLLVFPSLPDPSVATRQQLFHWLVLRDLSQESAETRQKILLRLDAEFEKAGDMDSVIGNLEESRRQMLWHNVTLLMEPWLMGKVQQYSQLPASQRVDYIDRFLDRAELWNQVGAACLTKDSGPGSNGGTSASKLIMEQIQQCSNRAGPEQRPQIAAFMAAAQVRWLWRQLPSFGRPGGGGRRS